MIGSAVLLVGLVVAAIVLATRKPAPAPTPVGVATSSASPSASASASATPSPSPTLTPNPTATPTAHPTATATPTPPPPPPQNTPTEQANLLFPASGSECGGSGNYAGCPVTSDLVTNANRWRSNHPAAPEPLCRCPSTYASPFAQQDGTLLPPGDQGNPNLAAVQVSLSIPPAGPEKMVVLFARQANGSWLAYDTYCDNRMNSLTAGAPTTC